VKLLIGTDGSDLALAAAARAGELFASVDSVTVLAVSGTTPGDDAGGIEGSAESPDEIARDLANQQAGASAAIDATVTRLPEAWRPKVVRRVEGGDPGPMLTWVAEQEGSDAIVVGSHGHGMFKRLVLGSVSEHVVRHAPCPVLVVRRPPE
jgi:nucleotide-binding universal stress UspA family protein